MEVPLREGKYYGDTLIRQQLYLFVGYLCIGCYHMQVADSLEKGTEHEDEYMISEKELIVNRYVKIQVRFALCI